MSSAPDSTSEQNTATDQTEEPTKAGIWNIDLLAGGALGVYQASHMGALILRPAVAVTANRNGYLILPLQFQLASNLYVVSLGFGFQYDVPLYKSLYLTPRISLGYSALVLSAPAPIGTATTHLGNLTPEVGLKYIFNGRFNLGADLFSLPILFNQGGASIFYRLLAVFGINF